MDEAGVFMFTLLARDLAKSINVIMLFVVL